MNIHTFTFKMMPAKSTDTAMDRHSMQAKQFLPYAYKNITTPKEVKQ
jgi:hypothetical protein